MGLNLTCEGDSEGNDDGPEAPHNGRGEEHLQPLVAVDGKPDQPQCVLHIPLLSKIGE